MKKKYIIKKARKLLVEQINSHQTIVRNDMNNIETMSNMKGLSEVIPKDNDGYCTIYKMDCADGLGLMTVYQVFPGIQLIYNDFEATEYEWESILDKDILEINHCREGREGSRLLSGSCLYLGEGDLSIHTMDNCASEMSFPLKHYRGISVVINLTTVSKNSPEILMEAGIDILAFRNKFCASGDCFIMRAKDEIEHIFSELYSIPDCLQKPYMKLKVQELLLFLYTVDAAKEKQRERYTSPHVEIVKEIHKKLVSDLQKRPTIEELSKEFLINTATLKNTFKGIYGQPIGRGLANTRMRDFYDVYEIMNSKADQISFDVLKKAFAATCMKRETSFGEEEVRETLDKIKDDFGLDEMWNHFKRVNYFVNDLSWGEVSETIVDNIEKNSFFSDQVSWISDEKGIKIKDSNKF